MLPTDRFMAFIEQHQLFTRGNRILAAVSGGMDSVLLAHLLKAAGFNFGIAHCNFQLRDREALADQEFCYQLASRLGVPFHTINFDTKAHAANGKISIQMAARDLRYQWFEEQRLQNGYDVIALAHHHNDAIETILLNLVRGTGIAGLHGILPRNGALVRPMLFMEREEIRTLIADNHLGYVEDSSNASTKYARNKIRLEVIPKLKELNPSLEHTFDKNLEHFRSLELLLEQQTESLRKRLFTAREDGLYLPLEELQKLVPQKLMLFKLLQEFGVNETIVEDIIASLGKHSGRTFETGSFRLILDRKYLIVTSLKISREKEAVLETGVHEVDFSGFKLTVLHDDSQLIVKNNPMAVSVDAENIIFPMKLRYWQQGDYFFPLGMKLKKKLSDFFTGLKIPLHQKNGIPLLINGNGDIVWVGGYRLDERYKVDNNTKKVFIFELVKT